MALEVALKVCVWPLEPLGLRQPFQMSLHAASWARCSRGPVESMAAGPSQVPLAPGPHTVHDFPLSLTAPTRHGEAR